jgi:hypothetical protein
VTFTPRRYWTLSVCYRPLAAPSAQRLPYWRGPLERDSPAYTLQGYRLAWTVAAPDGQRVFAQGLVTLPTLPPGATWSGAVEWAAVQADCWLTLRLLRPTGFAAFEHTYDAHGERR